MGPCFAVSSLLCSCLSYQRWSSLTTSCGYSTLLALVWSSLPWRHSSLLTQNTIISKWLWHRLGRRQGLCVVALFSSNHWLLGDVPVLFSVPFWNIYLMISWVFLQSCKIDLRGIIQYWSSSMVSYDITSDQRPMMKNSQYTEGLLRSAKKTQVQYGSNNWDHSGYALSQWEEALLCNASSHWPIPYSEWSLNKVRSLSHWSIDQGWGLLSQFTMPSRTKPSSANLPFFFRIIKMLVACWTSHSYLTGTVST